MSISPPSQCLLSPVPSATPQEAISRPADKTTLNRLPDELIIKIVLMASSPVSAFNLLAINRRLWTISKDDILCADLLRIHTAAFASFRDHPVALDRGDDVQSAIVSLKPRRWLWPLYDASGAPTRLRLLRLKSVICNTCESFTTISPPFSALRHQHRATIRWLYLCYHFLFGTPAPMGTKAVQNLEVIRHRSIRFGTDQTSYQRARSSTPKLLTCAPCRQQELSVALYKRGISFKDESTLCKDYVARGQPSVHFIVEKLMQSHIAHEHSVVDYFIDRETIFAGSSGAYLPEQARLQELERLGRELFHHVILQGGYGKPNTCTCGLPLIKSYISRNRERLYVLFHMRSNDFLHLIGSLINADSTRLDARIGAQDQLYNLYAAVQHRSALSLRFRCHMQVVAISDVAFIARLRSLSHSFLSTFLNSTASIPRVRER